MNPNLDARHQLLHARLALGDSSFKSVNAVTASDSDDCRSMQQPKSIVSIHPSDEGTPAHCSITRSVDGRAKLPCQLESLT